MRPNDPRVAVARATLLAREGELKAALAELKPDSRQKRCSYTVVQTQRSSREGPDSGTTAALSGSVHLFGEAKRLAHKSLESAIFITAQEIADACANAL